MATRELVGPNPLSEARVVSVCPCLCFCCSTAPPVVCRSVILEAISIFLIIISRCFERENTLAFLYRGNTGLFVFIIDAENVGGLRRVWVCVCVCVYHNNGDVS